MGSVSFGRPVVFGSAERPLAGRLHEPVSAVVGAVLLCNPFGYEENCAYRTFRMLAQRLAERGFEVLRFDQDGCGNSWGGATDPDRLPRWIGSCTQAIDFLSARNRHPVRVVGLRMGAALAVLSSTRQTIERLVLWDPVVSGKRYLRALRATSMLGLDAVPEPSDPGSLVVIGHRLSSSTIQSIGQLDLNSVAAPQIGTALLICRPQSGDALRLAEAMQKQGVPITVEEHDGTDLLLDCAAEVSVIPLAIVARIVDFVSAQPGAPLERDATPVGPTVLVAPAEPGWTETHLPIGPHGLAGILSVPQLVQRRGVVILTNNGVARCVGPARAWVEWARLWAGLGIATLRVDFSGIGDSEPRAGQLPGASPSADYPIQSLDDFADIVAMLRASNLMPAVAIGLCSGAFLSLDAAAANIGLEGVVGISTELFYVPDPPQSAQRSRRAAPPGNHALQRFLENTRLGRRVVRHLPFAGWWLFDILGLRPSPLRGATAACAHARVLLIYGKDTPEFARMQRQAGRNAMSIWQRDGRMTVLPGMDHSMFAPRVREQVEQRIRSFLEEILPQITGSSAPQYNPSRSTPRIPL